MARMTVDEAAFDQFIEGLKGLADNVDAIADEILDSVSSDVVSAFQSNIRSAATRGYSTGALASSIEATESKMNAYGHFIAARPTGTDSSGTRNGEKLAYLEYGTPHQAARPVVAKTVAQTEGKVTEKIKQEMEQRITKYTE